MSIPLFPVTHGVPAEFGLHTGYDFIRQMSIANPDRVVFDAPLPEELSCGAVFQMFKNYNFNEDWNGTIVSAYISEWIGNHRHQHIRLYDLFKTLERQFYARYSESNVPRQVLHYSLNGASVADAKMLTELQSPRLSLFRWRNRNYLCHPCGEILNEVHFDELLGEFKPNALGKSLKHLGHFDLRSPVKKMRASCPFYCDSQSPLIAVQLAVPELAIFRFERGMEYGHPGVRTDKDRVVLVEHLQFSENIVSFCWDERPATMRDTQSLVVLTAEGALYLWQGSDRLRVLRSPEAVDEVCEPLPSVRHTQGVSSITKIAEVGKSMVDDGWLPNYGIKLFFSGNPSNVLILTANSVERVDFSRSVSLQETLLSLFKPPSALDVRHMRLRGQFENVANERANRFNRQRRIINKRRKQLLEEDEEAFRTTTQIRLEAEETGRPVTDNPIYKFYSPILVPFDVEFEAKKAQGPTIRLMQDEMLCDAAQHPTLPFRFAILTTIRVYLLDERRPDTPLIQWRHHLVKTRRSLYERRIPFSPEQPHTLQFIIPPPHLDHLQSLHERTFVLISNSQESEIYVFDEGPTAHAVHDPSKPTETAHMDQSSEEDDSEPLLTPHNEYKRQLDVDITTLMDAITRDITRSNDPPAKVKLISQCLNLFRPPPCPPRLIGLAQKAFARKVPFLEEVDPMNTDHIARRLTNQIQNISTAAMIGTWLIDGAEPQLSFLSIRLDIRGHLFGQIHRIQIEDEDKGAIVERQRQEDSTGSETESDDGSEESSSSASVSGSHSSSDSSQSNTSDSSDGESSSSSSGSESDGEGNLSRGGASDRPAPFNLKQPGAYHKRKRSKHLWQRKDVPLAQPSSELPNFDVYDSSTLAQLVYDPRPGYHPNDSYPKALEERRLKSILDCEGDYEKLKEMVTSFSRQERNSYRAIKRRIDPLTQKLVPSETRHESDPDWYDVTKYRKKKKFGEDGETDAMGVDGDQDGMNAEIELDESIIDENGGHGSDRENEGDGTEKEASKAQLENAAPTGAKEAEDTRFDRKRWMRFMRLRRKGAVNESATEDEEYEHPARKRVLRRLPEDTLDLSLVQYEFFLDQLEDVLRDIDIQGDWEELEMPPIDPKCVFDALPIDRAAVERIVRRVLGVVLGTREVALRTTAEMYRELVAKRQIHPLYFPPCFLRSILAFYVAKGTIDYVSLRKIQTPTGIMTDRYPSGQTKPWTLEDRIQSRDHDPYLHYLTLNDELDAFVLNPTGLMDVDAEYFIGVTDVPRHEPIPALREKSTVSEITWRAPRLPYPPMPEETITTASSLSAPASQQPILTQNQSLSQPRGRDSSSIPLNNMSSSQFLPPTQPISQMAQNSQSIAPPSSSIPLNRSISLSFAPPTQPLSRQQTNAQLRAERDRVASRTADLASQQSQIMELLQTQQTIAEIHMEQEMRELEEDKKEDTVIEKLHAPANASQLMAYLLCKWESDYESVQKRVSDARKVLKTVPKD